MNKIVVEFEYNDELNNLINNCIKNNMELIPGLKIKRAYKTNFSNDILHNYVIL